RLPVAGDDAVGLSGDCDSGQGLAFRNLLLKLPEGPPQPPRGNLRVGQALQSPQEHKIAKGKAVLAPWATGRIEQPRLHEGAHLLGRYVEQRGNFARRVALRR